MSELKKFKIYWSVSFDGVDEIEAFDEQDAEDQFDSIIQEDRIPNDRQLYASIDEIVEVKENKKKKVKKK